jgi:hypothetical protein
MLKNILQLATFDDLNSQNFLLNHKIFFQNAFFIIDFHTLSDSLKAALSVDIHCLKPKCSGTNLQTLTRFKIGIDVTLSYSHIWLKYFAVMSTLTI